jgi:hypothetical protein
MNVCAMQQAILAFMLGMKEDEKALMQSGAGWIQSAAFHR